MLRQIVVFRKYFLLFYEQQDEKVQLKIEWILNLIRTIRQVPEKYFKHVEGTKGLYEIRIEVGNNIYRIFSFFDEGNLVVLGNAFQKKSQETPKEEINKAIKIMEEYFYEKQNNKGKK